MSGWAEDLRQSTVEQGTHLGIVALVVAPARGVEGVFCIEAASAGSNNHSLQVNDNPGLRDARNEAPRAEELPGTAANCGRGRGTERRLVPQLLPEAVVTTRAIVSCRRP